MWLLLWQHLSHQPVRLLPLYLQLLCPLSNQILQVGGVLFQHAQHGVNNVCLLPLGDAFELSQERQGQVWNLQLFTYVQSLINRGAGLRRVFFTCLKISSKVGLLSGSSLQACFKTCITSSGASSTDRTGRHKGGGSLTLLIISAITRKHSA